MTRDQLTDGIEKLRTHFHGLADYNIDDYADKLEDVSPQSWRLMVDRARAEYETMPSPAQLLHLFKDLTYWEVTEFFSDWNRAYFDCTGEDYYFGWTWPPDPEYRQDPGHKAMRDAEEMRWIENRGDLRKFVFRRGGVSVIKAELTSLASTGNLVNRTMSEYLRGEDFRHSLQLGWRKPDIPAHIPKSEVASIIKQVDQAANRRTV